MSGQVQLSARDRQQLRAIRAELERLPVDGTPALSVVTGPIGELLGAELSLSYGLEWRDGALRCSFLHGAVPRRVARDITESLRESHRGWSRYDPFHPDRAQRNRVCSFAPAIYPALGQYSLLRRHQLHEQHQTRALICDGPVLLAWVGAMHQDPTTPRQRQLLAALIPALRQRLRLERRLERGGLVAAALEAALEQLGAAAYLLGPGGAVVHVNAAGRQQLASAPQALAARLQAAARGDDPRFEVHALDGRAPRGVLLVERAPPGASEAVARAAAVRWSLTPRQAQVLELLIEGHTNARIAAELGIAPGTVELHVSAILARAGCDNRASLAAAAWSPAGARA